MNFDSQICTTREQSERLLNLGLKKQTADCFHWNAYGRNYIGNIDDEGLNHDDVPAWSLDRLICMINDSDTSEDSKIEFYIKLNRYDEAIALIQSLIHIGRFNKEYLT